MAQRWAWVGLVAALGCSASNGAGLFGAAVDDDAGSQRSGGGGGSAALASDPASGGAGVATGGATSGAGGVSATGGKASSGGTMAGIGGAPGGSGGNDGGSVSAGGVSSGGAATGGTASGGASAVNSGGAAAGGFATGGAPDSDGGLRCPGADGAEWTVYTVAPGHCLSAGDPSWVGSQICFDTTPNDGVCSASCSDYLHVRVGLFGKPVRIAVLTTFGSALTGSFSSSDADYASWCYQMQEGTTS